MFLRFPKKGLRPNGPYISTFKTNLRNVCMLVIQSVNSTLGSFQLMKRPGIFTKGTVYYSSCA